VIVLLGYVDYSFSTAFLSYKQMSSVADQAASKNILADQFTCTGQFYGQLATAGAFTSITTTQMFTNKISGRIAGLLITVVVIGL